MQVRGHLLAEYRSAYWSATWPERLFLMKGSREGGTLMCKCKHGWHGDGTYFVRTTQPWNLEPCIQGCELCVHWDNCVKNWTETHYQLERQTCPSQVEGQTRNRTRELYKDIRRYVLAHAGDLQFRFQHGPFTKRFKPVITRVPAVVLSISRFSRLAVARAWLFALNQLTSEGTGSYSHLGPRPLRMSWLTCCCCTAVITCGIGLFHMARASSRLTSVQINTTKQFWLWGLAACLPPPPGAHICLKKCANVFTPPRRLQGSVIDCQGKKTCNKTKDTAQKKCRCTSYKSTRT